MSAPRPFLLLGALAALEGLALLAYAVIVAINAVSGSSYGVIGNSTSAMIIEISIFTVLGLGLLKVAHGWIRMSRWARGPFIMAQLIGLMAGISFIFSGASEQVVPGLVLAIPSVLGLVLSFSPVVLQTYSASYTRPGSDVD
ncbi:MAG: hypothetical protein Q8L05_00595 [Actinomycetota bacterium]|nr:hypothetical protein [Actinomycetota bacterium]MDP2288252.1 hypothetical protein [Actinomycetota bacterium]